MNTLTTISDEERDAFVETLTRNDVEKEAFDASTSCPALVKLASTIGEAPHFFIEHEQKYMSMSDHRFYERPLVTLVVKRADDLYVAVTYEQGDSGRWSGKHTEVYLGVPKRGHHVQYHKRTPVNVYTASSAPWALTSDQVTAEVEKDWLKKVRKHLKEEIDTQRARAAGYEESLAKAREKLTEMEREFRSYGWRLSR